MSALELVVAEALPAPALRTMLLADLALPNLDRVGARASASAPLDAPENASLTVWQAWLLRADPQANLAQLWARALTPPVRGDSRALWLAEPVHLEVGLDQVALLPPDELGLEGDAARELAAAARPVLAAAGWRLDVVSSARWLLSREARLSLSGAAIECAIGRNVVAYLPSGEPGAELDWRRVHNEIQMTWYAHPVNQAREARGEVSVNGLWLSGNGAPAPPTLPYAAIDSALPYLAAAPCDGRADARLETCVTLIAPAQRADWAAWRTALTAFDDQLGRRLAALKRREFERIELILTGEHEIRRFSLSRADLARFWRRGGAADLWQAPA